MASQHDFAEEEIKQHFVQWWKDSYGISPGQHAIMTHVAYALKFYSDKTINAAASND